MYKNMIIEESGDLKKALDHLEEIRMKVVDKRSWREAKGGSRKMAISQGWDGYAEFHGRTARLLLKSESLAEAEVEYRQLLEQNADCHAYLDGLLQARGLVGDLDDTKMEKLSRLLNELGNKYPRSHVIRKMPLKFSKGLHRYIHYGSVQPLYRGLMQLSSGR